MNGHENSEHIDADILECKEDILRARDVIPPFDKPKGRVKETQRKERRGELSHSVSGEERRALADTKAFSIEAGDTRSGSPLTLDKTPENKEKQDKGKSDIPRFDLADDLMAAHRKAAAGRRRAPSEKTKQPPQVQKQPQPAEAKNIEKPPDSQQAEEDRIIAQIVAADIEKLYRGQSP